MLKVFIILYSIRNHWLLLWIDDYPSLVMLKLLINLNKSGREKMLNY